MRCITNIGNVSEKTNGYSTMYDSVKKKKVKTHRWVFEKFYGEIPNGLVVMHTCDNRACSNIQHLRLGTQRENILDMYSKGRQGQRNLPRNVSHHMTTLSLEQVEELRGIVYYHGLFSEKAKELGVTRQTIKNIYVGNTWKPAQKGPNYKTADLKDLV